MLSLLTYGEGLLCRSRLSPSLGGKCVWRLYLGVEPTAKSRTCEPLKATHPENWFLAAVKEILLSLFQGGLERVEVQTLGLFQNLCVVKNHLLLPTWPNWCR